MDTFTLSLLILVVFSSMAAYFAIARQDAAARPGNPGNPKPQPAARPAAAVQFVHPDAARLQQPERIPPIFRQNVAVARLLRVGM